MRRLLAAVAACLALTALGLDVTFTHRWLASALTGAAILIVVATIRRTPHTQRTPPAELTEEQSPQTTT